MHVNIVRKLLEKSGILSIFADTCIFIFTVLDTSYGKYCFDEGTVVFNQGIENL